MDNGTAKVAILLNGPPRAGKDTGSDALAETFGSACTVLKFTKPVKDVTHGERGLSCAHDAYEELKDVPLPEFGGMTPRQAYIEASARWKRDKGPHVFADMFVSEALSAAGQVIVNPDCGDDMEAGKVAEAIGFDRVLVIRVHRDGHDFSQDCRDWVRLGNVTVIDVRNEPGRLREYQSEVVAHARAFVDRVMGLDRAYAA